MRNSATSGRVVVQWAIDHLAIPFPGIVCGESPAFPWGWGVFDFYSVFFWREICYDIYIYRTRGNYLLGEEVPLDDSSCKLWILRCFALALSNEPKSFLRCGSPAALACSSLGRTRAFYGVSFTNLRQIQRLRCIIPRGIYIVWLGG